MLNNQIKLLSAIKELKPELLAISHAIHSRPELGNREFFALQTLTTFLQEKGWQVKSGAGGLPTSFVAYQGEGKRPAVAFLAEYDALPEIGHGCGHNLICTASLGAAEALHRVMKGKGGEIRVIGTPAEETTGGKIPLLKDGLFADLDAVMMFHPGISNVIHFSSLALEALEVTFSGKAGHSAVLKNTWGDSLQALLKFFFWLGDWKKLLPQYCQVDGVIIEGGSVPNVRPAQTKARFYLRALEEKTLDLLMKEFILQAQSIAENTGTRVIVAPFEARYLPFKSNETLAKVFVQSLRHLKIKTAIENCQALGSMDIGNVSQKVPAIHPYLTLENGPSMLHTAEFAQAVGGPWGDELLILAAQALALTGFKVLNKEYLRSRIKAEHQKHMESSLNVIG